MNSKKYKDLDTLSEVVDALTEDGFTENFKAQETHIQGLYSKKHYKPDQLKILDKYRFEGMTNPSDQSELFAIEASDGTRGTLTMNYSAESSQNVDLIIKIEELNAKD